MCMCAEGATAYLDDIIDVGRSKQEMTERIKIVLTRIQNFGCHFCPEKCHFYLQTIKDFGFIFNHRPYPANVAAIH